MAWHSDRMECAICNREWVAAYPEEAERLECPGCGYMNQPPAGAQRETSGADDDDGEAWKNPGD